MLNEREFVITSLHHKERLDKVVASLCDLSRSYAQTLIVEGYVLVNDEEVMKSKTVQVNDVVSVSLKEVSLELVPVFMNLDVLYEDEHLIVINKPSGLVVHPSESVKEPTLVEGLMAQVSDLSTIGGVKRPGIVHRLDKDTSGCIVVAKHDEAHQGLSSQLVDKTMNRTYVALTHGQVVPNVFKIDAPIGRDPQDRQKMCVTHVNAKDAITHVKVLETMKKHSLIECRLETGRTHQIRVHLSYIKFPIVNDPKYGPRKLVDAEFGQCLHAKSIDFIHPITKQAMHFDAPLPKAMEDIIDLARKELL
ncbi:MAG: RluA family pseudouridine synthase [Erysipelotrichia bacterium]|jgi:23S rRNA pseudouridine1911/1915/1917 synthase|nr:RluA family pseudouridine synthase [Erysipelotrichia bacterium]